MNFEKIAWKGWPNCYRISNAEVDLILTGDVGPRIMHFGFLGGQNLFKEFADQLGKSGETSWQIRGGHRLWKGPEDRVATYALDNGSIEVHQELHSVVALQPVEPQTGLRKKMELRLDGARVTVTHTIENCNALAVEIAAWTPTAMAQGGRGIVGFPPRGTHPEVLEPTNPLVMWAFTDLGDERLQFTRKYLTLRQDPGKSAPQKLGTWAHDTWGAYLLGSELFVKEYTASPGAVYPEMGASFEIFTNADFLELETMGPLTRLGPGEAVQHVERWSLHRDVRVSEWTDEELDTILVPLLRPETSILKG